MADYKIFVFPYKGEIPAGMTVLVHNSHVEEWAPELERSRAVKESHLGQANALAAKIRGGTFVFGDK